MKKEDTRETFILMLLSPLLIVLGLLYVIWQEFKKQKVIVASAGEVKKKIKRKKQRLFIKDEIKITFKGVLYTIGERFIPVRINGNSMTEKGIYNEDIAIFDSKAKDYQKEDIILIKLPANDEVNPQTYKLRLFYGQTGNKVITEKYVSDGDKNTRLKSSKQHDISRVRGKFIFKLTEESKQNIYNKYIVNYASSETTQ